MLELSLSNVHVRLGGRDVVRDASLAVPRGDLVALLGPNGAGKSTLIRAAVGLGPVTGGRRRIMGDDPEQMSHAERARRVAYLPQVRPLAWPVLVQDVVALGRFAHGASMGALTGEDAMAVTEAIQSCQLRGLATRRADTLSGGELARVHVARAMAARAPLLVADEPVAALDPLHQFQVMRLIRDFVDAGNAAVVVLHEAALAARFAHRLVWMKEGQLIADGPPGETLTRERLAQVYGIDAAVHRIDGQLLVALPVDS